MHTVTKSARTYDSTFTVRHTVGQGDEWRRPDVGSSRLMTQVEVAELVAQDVALLLFISQ
jgi:hypothetical protein